MDHPVKEISLSYVHLVIYKSYLIATIKEDELIDFERIEELRSICHDEFGNRKFVYISDRKYKYNVNPVVYIDLIQKNTLLGIGIILKEFDQASVTNFEKKFATVPFEMFHTREEAIAWANRLLKNSSS
ncbi:hypothetical protein [Christiangramia aquimixticola]|uniref:hypothetical protein n=1 Tax=Christiangramia aquimixticola TaxID=1697558 RepID=UPI003AA9D986